MTTYICKESKSEKRNIKGILVYKQPYIRLINNYARPI